ncbi:hypothetical protein ACI2I2_24275 [Scandinavium sp. NPDC088450]|uniref:hypothetical protein n=1 Tax=Scandinavium sp. NPDC088450 TaxID=3364514 RepID=UPI00384CCDF2
MMMFATAAEIAVHMLTRGKNPQERFVFACWSLEDIRAAISDWELNDDDLRIVHERLSGEFESGADVPVIERVVEELIEERRESRTVTIPAASLQMVMQLAGRKRLI